MHSAGSSTASPSVEPDSALTPEHPEGLRRPPPRPPMGRTRVAYSAVAGDPLPPPGSGEDPFAPEAADPFALPQSDQLEEGALVLHKSQEEGLEVQL